MGMGTGMAMAMAMGMGMEMGMATGIVSAQAQSPTEKRASPVFDTRPALDFQTHLFDHDGYPAAEWDLGRDHHGGPLTAQIDPTLAGENRGNMESLDGGARVAFPGPLLDPALQQFSPRTNLYPTYPLPDHMPYLAPQVDHFQCWLVAQDFDLAAFNGSFLPPTAAEFLGLNGPHAAPQWKDHDMPSPENGAMLSLRVHWERDLVPSIEFLNVAIQLFFTGFNPIFPIFHAPTWRPSDHSLLVLLSICSIGTLFMGSDGTTIQAAKMFETVHKTIQGSWATMASKPTRERLSLMQAGLIGQVFAYLSGNPKYLGLVKNFHINLVDLARRSELLESTRSVPLLENEATEALEEAWKSTAMGLYIQDAQFASTFHHPPLLQHDASRLSVASNDELFAAATPTRWAHLTRLSPTPTKLSTHLHVNQPSHHCTTPLSKELSCKDSRLSASLILHSISASVQASKASNSLSSSVRQGYEESLICWYHAYEETRTTQEPDALCLMVLYHEIFMSLLVDFCQLELAIGSNAPEAVAYARTWSTSIDAKRAIIHASLIHRQAEGIRYDAEPALHVPRSMFLAARAWYCYIHFDTSDQTLPGDGGEFDAIPEIEMFNIDPLQYLPGANGYGTGKPLVSEAATLGRLTDLLEQVGHWGIARRFAVIFRSLIYGEQQLV
ncbi:hypothetical protein BUE80_DR003458 [Diplocarpon rosae]|nr:hypothetical protein BUE80_DR003458 [Diplocarpon rosae]